MKRMDRRWDNIPREEIQKLASNMKPEVYASDWMSSVDAEQADELIGKSFCLIYEKGNINYSFLTSSKLKIVLTDGVSYECFYKATYVPGHRELVFVHHYIDGSNVPECIDLVLDFVTGYSVIVKAVIGHPKYAREVHHEISVGKIDEFIQYGAYIPSESSELVGKAVMWTMPSSTAKPPIKHAYISNKYYAIAMTRPDGSCFISADPADYIKIKENVFLVSAIEERRSGIQLTFVINTELLEDVVGHFGISSGNEIGDELRIVSTVMTGRKGKWTDLETVF